MNATQLGSLGRLQDQAIWICILPRREEWRLLIDCARRAAGAAGRHGGSGMMGDAQQGAPGWALVGVTLLFFERQREKKDLGMLSCACLEKRFWYSRGLGCELEGRLQIGFTWNWEGEGKRKRKKGKVEGKGRERKRREGKRKVKERKKKRKRKEKERKEQSLGEGGKPELIQAFFFPK